MIISKLNNAGDTLHHKKQRLSFTCTVDDISITIKLIRHTGKIQNSIFKILFQTCLNDVSQIPAWRKTWKQIVTDSHLKFSSHVNFLIHLITALQYWEKGACVLTVNGMKTLPLSQVFCMHNASAVRMQCNRWYGSILCSSACHKCPHSHTRNLDTEMLYGSHMHTLSEQTNQSCVIKSLKNNKTKHETIGLLCWHYSEQTLIHKQDMQTVLPSLRSKLIESHCNPLNARVASVVNNKVSRRYAALAGKWQNVNPE